MRTRRNPLRRMSALPVFVALVALVVACGDDGPSGPSDDFDIVGDWSFSVNNATAGNATCSVSDITLTFMRTGGTLVGHRVSTAADNVSCTINGSTSTSNYTTNDDIDDLSHSGTDISFAFATTAGDWTMDGDIETDDLMDGTATIRIGTSAGTLVLTGPWRATRD
jgi:hypothetical protein